MLKVKEPNGVLVEVEGEREDAEIEAEAAESDKVEK